MNKQCVQCGREFQTKYVAQRFCGKPCAMSARHAATPSKWIEMTCPTCGKKHMALPSQSKGYCSAQCVTAAQCNKRRPDKMGEPLWEIAEDGCWNWRGGITKRYPMHRQAGVTIGAHRWSYQEHIGAIPAGWHVHHKCENTRCVNPDHLEARPPKKHIREHSRKLTDEQVAVILSSSAKGGVLATVFGVSQATISAVRRGRHYRD